MSITEAYQVMKVLLLLELRAHSTRTLAATRE